MSLKKEKVMYVVSAVLLFVFSSTFLMMPISNMVTYEESRIVSAIIGMIFWISGISGYGLLLSVYNHEHKRGYGKARKICIYSNLITSVADTGFVVGILTLIILVRIQISFDYLIYINIFIIALAFNIHWIFSRGIHKKLFKRMH